MGRIILSSIEQPLAQNAPRTNIYEGREVDPGRIRAQVQGGPEIHNGAAAGLASLAQGLSAWTGVARAWGRRKDNNDSQLEAADEPASAPDAQASRDLDLDRAALLEAVRAHEGEMAAFSEGQEQLNGREAIDDPLTGNQGLTGRALNWMQDFDQKFQPQFRRPETGEMYRQAVEQRRAQLLGQAGARQAGEEEAWREEVFEADLDLMVQTMFQDPSPQRLSDLDAEIETLWPGPESEERRAEIRDRSYGRIAQTILAEGNVDEAEAFINQHKDSFKAETAADLKMALGRKESELGLSRSALDEVLPDLALDEMKGIMAGGPAGESLEGLYQTAENLAGYRRGREEALAARQWLERPDRAFKALPELLAEAGRELKSEDGGEQSLSRYALVERELKQRQRRLNLDPLGQVGPQRDAAIKRLLAKGDLSEERGPELAQMQIALGRSLAKKMGMNDRGLVLSWAEAGQYRDQLAQAASPAERLDLLTGYGRLFGRYADRAFSQLDVPAEEGLAARLNQHPDPAARDLALLGLDRSAEPVDERLQAAARQAADCSRVGLQLKKRALNKPPGDPAREDLEALRNLAVTIVSAGAARKEPRPLRLALRALNALAESPGDYSAVC